MTEDQHLAELGRYAVERLNDALQRDPEAVHAMFSVRVAANNALAAHPTVQVSPPRMAEFGQVNLVSALGLINGALGCYSNGHGPVAIVWSTEPIRIIRFEVESPPESTDS